MVSLLALTGFMGSGKTTVGRALAELLGWGFIDLDEYFAKREGCTITAYFAAKGEQAFRAREYEFLEALLAQTAGEDGVVLALGGGTLESDPAVSLLRERAMVVYLETSAGEAWGRVEGSERPLAKDRREFEILLDRRKARYEDAADHVIPVGGRGVRELAKDIAGIIGVVGGTRHAVWSRRRVSTHRPSLIIGGVGALLSLQNAAADMVASGHRLFVVSDQNVTRHWGEHISALIGEASSAEDTLVFPAGERIKSTRSLERCWNWLAGQGARRDDTVIALGGGVVGDLAGFAAATYQRGIGLWQVPTTLLAQVDSSVGGKTAVNLGSGKNLVGSFYQPDKVIIDPETLSTLPSTEYANGLGEVVKYGLLDAGTLFADLENESAAVISRDAQVMGGLVKACVTLKSRVVEKDEFDRDGRAVLNLGHTVAHALEVTEGYGNISHGRAVALGLLVALAISERLLGLDPSVRERTRDMLVGFDLPVAIELPTVEQLVAAASRDKKVVAGSTGFVGLRAIGDPVWGLNVPEVVLSEALEVIRLST